ncbi:MAG: shikimate kinase AroK [Candidatus Dormibacteraeota bacterium]|nr:shikimate kinase AroK [Candidatus Dormibacteraeota bacterium]
MGMMGAGKTTVGAALAARLGVGYADNDAALTARTGQNAATFALEHGIDELHRVEHDVLVDALGRDDRAVVGAPGSIALDPEGATVLEGQRVVWLRASLATLAARTHRDPMRPLLGSDPAAALEALMREREPAFARLASIVVDVDGLTADAIVEGLLA